MNQISEIDRSYMDASRTPEERTSILMSQMTLKEKIAQLVGNGVMAGEFKNIKEDIPDGCGHINGTFLKGEASAEARAETIEKIQRYLVEETRLGIPALFDMESTCGSFYTDAVNSPQAIAMGATFDENAVAELAELIGRQNRAEGYNHSLGPVFDIARDQRWGRCGESYGEDPTLVAKLGSSFVRGIQGNGDMKTHMAATGKHFLAYSMADDGKNVGNQRVSDQELKEVHLKPWAAAVESGIATVMNAYGVVNGEPVITSSYILTDLLRGQLGFTGPVVADYCSIDRCIEEYDTAASITDAGVQAFMAGLDVELPDVHAFNDEFTQKVRDGEIPMDRIDAAVRRVLELKFKMGIFEQPYPDYELIGKLKKEAKESLIDRKIASESAVLTKNEGVLPLKAGAKVAVIGPNGNRNRCFWGGYTYPGMLEMKANMSKIFTGMEGTQAAVEASKKEDLLVIDDIEAEIAWRYPEAKTIFESIKAYTPNAVYAQGCELNSENRSGFEEAIELAKQADVVVLALGGQGGWVEGCTSGEGIEHPFVGLPGVQAELAMAVIATGTTAIVVHMDIRPMAEEKVTHGAAAVLESWFSGAYTGLAAADILFGKVNPSGKLPMTCLAGQHQVPTYLGQLRGCGHINAKTKIAKAMAAGMGGPPGMGSPEGPGGPDNDLPPQRKQSDPYEPLFYFGHGLSYTSFAYSNLALSSCEMDIQGGIDVSFDVTNTGSCSGDEVVQFYFHDDNACMVRPAVELAGFQRISLAPGETAHLNFRFNADQTAFVRLDGNWYVEPGGIHLMIGSSCTDIRLKAEAEITGVTSMVSQHRTYWSASSYSKS